MTTTALHARARLAAAALIGTLLIAGCDTGPPPAPPPEPPAALPPTHAEYVERLRDAGLERTLLVERWIGGAHAALLSPASVELPHEERGVFVPHDVRSVGLAFDVTDGQTLRVAIERSDDSAGRLFAQLFYRDRTSVATPFREVEVLTDSAGGEFRLGEAGRYILRLQPELHAAIDYRVRLELEAALPFPVSGYTRRAVGSFFGDPRDAGRRRHEGIDIFAKRATPVLAVTDGVAVPRQSRLGGNTVWLRGLDRSFYFAHLDTVAIQRRQRVRAGDVLGYVGNTGNARTTPPHLHFGIYRRGFGAIDPFPYFESFTFDEDPPASNFERGFVEITTNALNLRPTPGTGGAPVATLDAGTVLEARAAAGDWLRVRRADGVLGWIHRRYQRNARGSPVRPMLTTWLRSAPDGQPVTRVRAGSACHVFDKVGGWLLIGLSAAEPLGWLPAGAVASATETT